MTGCWRREQSSKSNDNFLGAQDSVIPPELEIAARLEVAVTSPRIRSGSCRRLFPQGGPHEKVRPIELGDSTPRPVKDRRTCDRRNRAVRSDRRQGWKFHFL